MTGILLKLFQKLISINNILLNHDSSAELLELNELHRRRIVPAANCPGGELSFWRIILAANCPSCQCKN